MKNQSMWEQLNKPEFLFDSHCHIDNQSFNTDRAAVLDRAVDAGVEQIFCMGIDLESSKQALEYASQYQNCRAFFGIDPDLIIHTSTHFDASLLVEQNQIKSVEKLESLIQQESVTGIGEIGMDHYWTQKLDAETREISHKAQESLFRLQLELAQKYDLPVSIHSRNAEEACYKIVKDFDVTGIFHSFTGSYETAKKILDSGWGLGVNGIITFKNAQELRDIYIKLLGTLSFDAHPMDFYRKGVFFETDAPYLAPDGKRGQRNEPANIRDIYESLTSRLASLL